MTVDACVAGRRSRRRTAILTWLVVILTSAGFSAPAAFAAAEGGDEAPLSVDNRTVDLGTLIKGDKVQHDFVLRNPGEEPVVIERVAESCGCTVVSFDKVVPPGGEGVLHAELDTSTLTGKGSSTIEVYVEGEQGPALTLVLGYKVEPKLLADPGYARWIYVQHEEAGTISQVFYSADGADFDIVDIQSPSPAIEVAYREASTEERREDAQGSQWIIESTLREDAPVGPITGFIAVRTNHPEQTTARIPVSGFVRPALFVEPPRGTFGTVDATEPRPAVFRVRSFSSEPIELIEAETDVAGVAAEVVPVEEGRDYRVILKFDPETLEPGPFSGTLRVKTDSEKLPVLSVEFEGRMGTTSSDE